MIHPDRVIPICSDCGIELDPDSDYHTTNGRDVFGTRLDSVVLDWCPEHCPDCTNETSPL